MDSNCKTFFIAAAVLAVNASALQLSLKTEAKISECYLTRHDMLSRDGWNAEGVTTIDNFTQMTANDSVYPDTGLFVLDGISVCLERPEGHSDDAHRAVKGLQANLISQDGNRTMRYPTAIGDMSCADDSYFDLMHINGPQIGKVKLSFEADEDAGVAIKLKERDDDSWSWTVSEALGQNMIEALGEFDSDNKSVLVVPANEQLIGFFGT